MLMTKNNFKKAIYTLLMDHLPLKEEINHLTWATTLSSHCSNRWQLLKTNQWPSLTALSSTERMTSVSHRASRETTFTWTYINVFTKKNIEHVINELNNKITDRIQKVSVSQILVINFNQRSETIFCEEGPDIVSLTLTNHFPGLN